LGGRAPELVTLDLDFGEQRERVLAPTEVRGERSP
jgi:hypothetical protein